MEKSKLASLKLANNSPRFCGDQLMITFFLFFLLNSWKGSPGLQSRFGTSQLSELHFVLWYVVRCYFRLEVVQSWLFSSHYVLFGTFRFCISILCWFQQKDVQLNLQCTTEQMCTLKRMVLDYLNSLCWLLLFGFCISCKSPANQRVEPRLPALLQLNSEII